MRAGAGDHREASGKQAGAGYLLLHGWPQQGAGMESKRESRFAGWWHLQLCREEVFTDVGCGCGCL